MQLAEVKLGLTEVEREQGPVQVIALTSGSRGTGKTNIAVNLAHALARSGRRTMLLDADLGASNVDALLGLAPAQNLFDVMNGDCRLDDIILTYTDGLMVVPAASGTRQLAQLGCNECAGLVRAFSELDRPLDTLIVDTATGVSECVASFCRAASEVLVVVRNQSAAILESIAQMERLTADFGVIRFRILANRVASAAEGEAVFRKIITGLADDHRQTLSYAGFVPRDRHLMQATAGQTSVVSAFPRSRVAMSLVNLARQVSSWPQPVQPGGHVEFFVERMIQNENSGMEVTS